MLVQDIPDVKAYIKANLDTDTRIVKHGEPLTDQEQTEIPQRFQRFSELLKEINENYHDYIIKEIGVKEQAHKVAPKVATISTMNHLILDNNKIKKLADKYQANPQLVDQLIRARRISQGQIAMNNWGGYSHGDGNGGYNFDFRDYVVYDLECLYKQLFKDYTIPNKLHKKAINSHQIFYYTMVKQEKTDFDPVMTKAKKNIKAYNAGLVIDADTEQILFPVVDSELSVNLYNDFLKTRQVHFYNLEKIGVESENKDDFKIDPQVKAYCVVGMILITLILGATSKQPIIGATVLIIAVVAGLTYLFYSIDATKKEVKNIQKLNPDPDRLVKKYREKR